MQRREKMAYCARDKVIFTVVYDPQKEKQIFSFKEALIKSGVTDIKTTGLGCISFAVVPKFREKDLKRAREKISRGTRTH